MTESPTPVSGDDGACASTPSEELERQIMDSRVPKNEREWWAKREIERLRSQGGAPELRAWAELLENRIRHAIAMLASGYVDETLAELERVFDDPEFLRLRPPGQDDRTNASQETDGSLNQSSALPRKDVEGAAYRVGDRVEKYTGEAMYVGTVVSVYLTVRGKLRYVVDVEPQHFQMISNEAQLRPAIRDLGKQTADTEQETGGERG